MALITWNEHLVTGIAVVDRQHQGLVNLVNEAAPVLALSGRRPLAQAGPLLARLLDYAAKHFRTEEQLMAQRGVDPRSAEHHRRSHADFVEQVEAMAAVFAGGGEASGDQLLSFLASWTIFHILGEDQAMARQMRALDSGLSAGQAYERAAGAETNPSPAAVSAVLVDVYGGLIRQNRELTQINAQLDRSRREVEHHRQHLEELVNERTQQLQGLTEQLRKSLNAAEAGNRAKSRFLAAISHELRTPLNAILGFASLLRQSGLGPQQAESARQILAASQDLLKLINRVIDYARTGTAQAESRTETFELRSLLDHVCRRPFAMAHAKGVAGHLEIDPVLPKFLTGDPRHIITVLENLAANAAKFTETGMIRVEARLLEEAPPGRLRVRFTVSDTGIGIPEALQESAFGALEQLDDSLTREYGGIGLGLALARQSARRMEAELALQSEPGKGSLFGLELWLGRGGNAPSWTAPSPEEAISSPACEEQTSGPGDPAKTLALLGRLLKNYDTRAGDVMTDAAPFLRNRLGDRFEEFARRIAGFEYDRALKILREFEPT